MATEKRLIDANALLISETFTVSEGACKECENEYRWAIQEAPTVDAVEIVHGRWIEIGGNRYTRVSQCSNCCAKYDFMSPYCPNCGAKMDGDGNG